MGRHNLKAMYPIRSGCYLKQETYDTLKGYAALIGSDIGTVLRNIIEKHVVENKEKYDKVPVLAAELQEIKKF